MIGPNPAQFTCRRRFEVRTRSIASLLRVEKSRDAVERVLTSVNGNAVERVPTAALQLVVFKFNLVPAAYRRAQLLHHFYIPGFYLDPSKRNRRIQIRPGNRYFAFQAAHQLTEC